jgi:hypothetical protein
MNSLSPAAQAVLDAFWGNKGCIDSNDISKHVAAALRALVGANAYEVGEGGWYSLVIDVDDIYAIADELEDCP